MFNSLQSHGLLSTRLLCPWNFTGNNTGTDYYFLLQGIFPTQGSNPCLLPILHWQADSLPLCHLGSPQWLLLLSRFSHVQLCATPQEPTRLLCPWNVPGKNTGVGFHFLLNIQELSGVASYSQGLRNACISFVSFSIQWSVTIYHPLPFYEPYSKHDYLQPSFI